MSDPMLPHGTNYCQCGACGLYFRNLKAFDAHRYGPADDRACTATPELPDAGLELDSEGYWRFPKRAAPKVGSA